MHHTMPMLHNGTPVAWDEYLTRELTDGAVRFIEKSHEQPFYLFVSYNAPHEYLQAPEETIAKYARDAMTEVPGVPAKSRQVYAAIVDEMDQGIRKILDKLDELGIAEDTIVWFLSDHGGMRRTSDNRPLRGAKGNAYEGGLRVPFIVRWPGKVPRGAVLNHPVTSLDIGATSVSLADGNLPESGLHGRDLNSYITGLSNKAPHTKLFWHTGKGPRDQTGAMRDGSYKLMLRRGAVELYNLDQDPSVQKDLAGKQAERAERMLAEWIAWNQANGPPLWKQGKKTDYQYADYEWLKSTPHYRSTSKN